MDGVFHIVVALQAVLLGLTAILILSAVRLTFLQREFPLYWGPGCRRQHRILRETAYQDRPDRGWNPRRSGDLGVLSLTL